MCLVIVGTTQTLGQSDTLILKANDLTYQNGYEKSVFSRLELRLLNDSLELLMASSPMATEGVYSKLKQLVMDDAARFAGSSFDRMPELKKIKTIFSTIHSNRFNKYLSHVLMDAITKEGEYNCVTASAYYALVLSRLGISTSLKETPNHVYLEAYPNTLNLIIETTNPEKGYEIFSKDVQKDYVDYLKRQKIISAKEAQENSINQLFSKYFFESKTINYRQLSGILYYNQGVDDLEKKKYNSASINLEKAYYLYPSTQFKKALISAYSLSLDENKNYRHPQATRAARLIRLLPAMNREEIATYFMRNSVNKNLFQRTNSSASLDSVYDAFKKEALDSVSGRTIEFFYHAAKLYTKGRRNETIRQVAPHYQAVLRSGMDDHQPHENWRSYLAARFWGNNQTFMDVTPKSLASHQQDLETLIAEFPETIRDSSVVTMLFTTILRDMAFQRQDEGKIDFEKIRPYYPSFLYLLNFSKIDIDSENEAFISTTGLYFVDIFKRQSLQSGSDSLMAMEKRSNAVVRRLLQSSFLAALAYVGAEHYKQNKIALASPYHRRLEIEIEAMKVGYIPQSVSELYSAAWGYYLRLNNLTAAKNALRKGLSYLPNDPSLKKLLSY